MTFLRQQILSLGGSVHYNYLSLRAVAATLPVSSLLDLASRPDVIGISPNRTVVRSGSLLQQTTGASAAAAARTGLDGSGVGIAVLDPGIGWSHQNVSTTLLLGLKGPTRA